MQLEEITPDIFNLIFETHFSMASTFLRFGEHYESPEFRGKVFTFKEYKKWYVNNSPWKKDRNKFTYYTDWGGFNVPSEFLEPFYDGKFDPLSKKEKRLLGLFENRRGKKSSIMGTTKEDGPKAMERTLRHEVAHGLFYTSTEYQSRVLEALSRVNPEKRSEIRNLVVDKWKYHPSRFEDEMHAYILDPKSFLLRNGVEVDSIKPVRRELKKIFREHTKGINFKRD
ncbi:MAG: ABC transporter ATP-binding protein [Nanoarchaeota archaeon]